MLVRCARRRTSAAASAAGKAAQAVVALAFGYHNTMDAWEESPEMAARGRLCADLGWETSKAALRAEEVAQTRLLRELVMSPFRPVRMETAWLRWINGPIRRLLRAIDREQNFDSLPVVADMIEDAGCTSAPLLAHCRLPYTEHVRGCWAVDFLLRKE